MRPLTVGLIGAAALVVGILIIREVSAVDEKPRPWEIPAGESEATRISLDRIRAVGY